MPDLVKIGCTSKDPKERAKEQRTTGVPSPFVVEYEALTEDYERMEKQAHRRLHKKRYEGDREFFSCTINEAVIAIKFECGDRIIYENYAKERREKVEREIEAKRKEEAERKDQLKREKIEKERKEQLEWQRDGAIAGVGFGLTIITIGIINNAAWLGVCLAYPVFLFIGRPWRVLKWIQELSEEELRKKEEVEREEQHEWSRDWWTYILILVGFFLVFMGILMDEGVHKSFSLSIGALFLLAARPWRFFNK